MKNEFSNRDRTITSLADGMPSDRKVLLAVAQQAAKALHRATFIGDQISASKAYDRYEAVCWLLNGRTFFGSLRTPDGGAYLVAEHCRAPDGEVPLWFQPGRFVVETNGMRCLVEAGAGFCRYSERFGLYAVDLDRPFLSATGFRSVFAGSHAGATVDELARHVVQRELEATGRVPVQRPALAPVEDPATRWPWLDHVPAAKPSFVESDGQIAFAF